MLNIDDFRIGDEYTVIEHTCPKCGHESTLLFQRGYKNDRTFLVGPLKYQCDRRQYFARYICPSCGNKNLAYGHSAFGNPEPNAKVAYRELTTEDLKRYCRDFEEAVELTEDDNEFVTNPFAP